MKNNNKDMEQINKFEIKNLKNSCYDSIFNQKQFTIDNHILKKDRISIRFSDKSLIDINTRNRTSISLIDKEDNIKDSQIKSKKTILIKKVSAWSLSNSDDSFVSNNSSLTNKPIKKLRPSITSLKIRSNLGKNLILGWGRI